MYYNLEDNEPPFAAIDWSAFDYGYSPYMEAVEGPTYPQGSAVDVDVAAVVVVEAEVEAATSNDDEADIPQYGVGEYTYDI